MDQQNPSPQGDQHNSSQDSSSPGLVEKIKGEITSHPRWAIALAVTAVLTFSLGYMLSGGSAPSGEKKGAKGDGIKYWSCSMHPKIQKPGPGKCPICFMDLIPVKEGSGTGIDPDAPMMELSPAARKLAEIETSPVLYRRVNFLVRLYGKIDYDETRLTYITTRFPGRIEELFVDFTGISVRKGDHLATLYSPDFRAAQEELLSDQDAYQKALQSKEKMNIRLAREKLEASKKKLLLWDLKKSQIDEILDRKKTSDEITIYATAGGTVLHKNATVGMYAKEGEKLYTIADLDRVWVMLDAYERDVPWLRYGQQVRFEVEAYPGREFAGRVAFIDPVLNQKTRSVKIRVEVANPDGALKPGMLARAIVEAQLAQGGRAVNTELVGKWVCPMHPYIVASRKGQKCSRCQMALEPADQLGFVGDHQARTRVLTIPHTAPLLTGKRAVVYVEDKMDSGQFRYEGKVVELGPRAGDYYVVMSGLEEGQKVVTRGNFKIDSALEIVAKPSMMTVDPEGEKGRGPGKTPPYGRGDGRYHQQMEPVIETYLQLQMGLALEKKKELEGLVKEFILAVEKVDPKKDEKMPKLAREKLGDLLGDMVRALKKAKWEMKPLRTAFVDTSKALETYLENYGHQRDQSLYRTYCPMAFDNKGGAWIQDRKKIYNTYEGSNMLHCGSIQQTFPPLDAKAVGNLAEVDRLLSPYFRRPFHEKISQVIEHYLMIQKKLTQGETDFASHQNHILRILRDLDPVKHFTQVELNRARTHVEAMSLATADLRGQDLIRLRRDFLDLSQGLIQFIRTFGHTYEKPLFVGHCPMYRKGLGGHWLQLDSDIANPYMAGKAKCGEIVDTFPRGKRPKKMKKAEKSSETPPPAKKKKGGHHDHGK